MGMGNNQVFRVKVHVATTSEGQDVFRFEHPTQPGQQSGGWMTRVSDKPVSAGFGRLLAVAADAPEAKPAAAPSKAKTLEELSQQQIEV